MMLNDMEEHFWIILIKKGEVPRVRSMILYKTIFKRWNAIKVFLSTQIENTPALLTFHTAFLRTETKWLWHEVLIKVLVWNFPHVRVKSIVWSAARYEPWDRSWMDDHINFSRTDTAHYCKEIFSVISFVWAQSDENDSFVLEIHRGFNKGSDGPPV